MKAPQKYGSGYEAVGEVDSRWRPWPTGRSRTGKLPVELLTVEHNPRGQERSSAAGIVSSSGR
jgi:hypothetical protein